MSLERRDYLLHSSEGSFFGINNISCSYYVRVDVTWKGNMFLIMEAQFLLCVKFILEQAAKLSKGVQIVTPWMISR